MVHTVLSRLVALLVSIMLHQLSISDENIVCGSDHILNLYLIFAYLFQKFGIPQSLQKYRHGVDFDEDDHFVALRSRSYRQTL